MFHKIGFGDEGKEDITTFKFIYYNLIFFIPLYICFIISKLIGSRISKKLLISANSSASILMIFFTLIIFLIVIPYIRKRENIKGVRYALIGFLVVGIMVAVPSMIVGNFKIILTNLIFIASYILLTFIYTPEVLGIDEDLSMYFEHSKQLIVILVYVSIVLSYVLGFSNIYHQIYLDNDKAYNFAYDEKPTFGTFAYFSMITFATIGYGDITPAVPGTRMLTMIQAIFGMIINVIFIAILFMYISNIQSWMKKEEIQIEKEEKKIIKEEEKVEKIEKKLNKRLYK